MNLSHAHKVLKGVGCCDKHPEVIFEGGECPWEVPPNHMDFQNRNYKVFFIILQQNAIMQVSQMHIHQN